LGWPETLMIAAIHKPDISTLGGQVLAVGLTSLRRFFSIEISEVSMIRDKRIR
jgi:hypothetical protein